VVGSKRGQNVSAGFSRPSLVERIDLWFSKGHLVGCIWVGSCTSDAKPANQRIEDALRLIER
jgi:hypothetical protein